jgi:hypothetical protein
MDNESSMDHSENTSFVFSNADRDSVSISTRNSEGKIIQDVQETRLVIGLDYGTTYTGMLLTHILDRVSLAQTRRCLCYPIWSLLLPRGHRCHGRMG